MAQTIKLKRSATPSAIPSTASLSLGEVAINTYDGKMFIKKDDGTEAIVEIGSGGGVSSFADNAKLTFGNSADLEIFHDGSHSYVSDAGAGQLRLKGDTVAITNQLNTEYLALFNEDSDVKLYYNSEQKLATTSTGIDVTGTATINSGTNGTTAALLFKTTDNVDVSKYIRMSSYYMEYSGNSNEGHHFIDSNSASLLKVFGSTHSSYPRRIGMGTETPAGKLHIATGLEPNNVYITTGASGGTGYDVTLNMLGGANNSEMVINLGIDGDADKNQIKSYQGNLYTRVNNSQRAEINSAGKHTWWGTHQGDGVGHFLFTNQGFDTSDVNCSLVVQNGQTFLQVMAWASHGARIGTRIGGWSATGSQGTYLVAADATNIICTSGGSPTLSNGTGITSDERLKENITDIEDGQLAKIIALRPRNFTWKDSRKSGNMEGFIAQEVESIIPEAVEEREVAPDPTDTSRDFEGDVKVIKHEVLNARLIKAIQEQQALIESLTTRLETLENA